ncbi:conserved hypothetical protein [Culex quinquefasciatus]|uniref:Uncharacterized protein n=1 Tax=Culex quinquefasciatus TaxID=7176 RepID=B0XBN1_CULQU|nr:conserved hypothetical protein [Culex quinquefasciatus]|eukprot:XP_001867053.1 conserved hypothetical protein [Culex quinquefasciatus]
MFRSLKFAGAKLSNAGEHLKRGVLSLVWPETSPSFRNKGVFTLSSIPRPFTIRLAKAQDDPHIMHFIREHFYCQEPLLKSLKVTKSMANPCLESRLCDHLKDGFTMIAVENKDNRIVGVAVNQRNCVWDGDLLKHKADSVKCDSLRKLFYIWSIVSTEPKLHEKYNTDCIFENAHRGLLKLSEATPMVDVTIQTPVDQVDIQAMTSGISWMTSYILIDRRESIVAH